MQMQARSAGIWLPSESTAFRWLLVPRLLAAFLMHISDCDETYNYWEPAHHLLYGGGFQTWEYSPAYALRSYGYILIHIFPLLATNTTNKLIAFYLLRVILAAACALSEAYFYRAIATRFGSLAARRTLLLLVFSCGMYIAAPAFLPSSFTMYLGMIALGAWFLKDYTIAIFAVAASTLIGWPFSAALGDDITTARIQMTSSSTMTFVRIPIAVDVVFYQKRPLYFIFISLLSFIVISVPLVAVDSIYYGRPVLAPLNIVLYNVFGKGGPDLYGVEPLSYYFYNGVLNFNVVFLLALLSPLLVEAQVFWEVMLTVLGKGKSFGDTVKNILSAYQGTSGGATVFVKSRDYRKVIQPIMIWILIFFTRPHKEERFLFPIYPLICLSSVVALQLLPELSTVVLGLVGLPRSLRRLSSLFFFHLPAITIVVHSLLSLSRVVALHAGYSAPMEVYKSLNSHEILSLTDKYSNIRDINVCVGKEWHRFPSSFFLPNKRWRMRFIKSDFKGQLPGLYSNYDNATSAVPEHMNDMNREEPSRYFPVEKCHFLVDLDLSETTPLQPRYSQDSAHWRTLVRKPFLDSNRFRIGNYLARNMDLFIISGSGLRSHRLYRAFYTPWLSQQNTHYVDYVLLCNRIIFNST